MLSGAEKTLAKNHNLSSNFTLYELIRSASYPDLVVYPDGDILGMLEDFAKNTLQKIRDEFGRVSIGSGYRNPELNKKVGGVSDSVHQYIIDGEVVGKAGDISPDLHNCSLEEMFHWIIDNHKELGLRTAIIYRKNSLRSKNFVHLDSRGSRPSFVAMEKMGPGDYALYKRD